LTKDQKALRFQLSNNVARSEVS